MPLNFVVIYSYAFAFIVMPQQKHISHIFRCSAILSNATSHTRTHTDFVQHPRGCQTVSSPSPAKKKIMPHDEIQFNRQKQTEYYQHFLFRVHNIPVMWWQWQQATAFLIIPNVLVYLFHIHSSVRFGFAVVCRNVQFSFMDMIMLSHAHICWLAYIHLCIYAFIMRIPLCSSLSQWQR